MTRQGRFGAWVHYGARATVSALAGGAALGFGFEDDVLIVSFKEL
jgi:hypothetical protein